MAKPAKARPIRKNWTIAPMWEGQTCAIFASGPSMSEAVAESVKFHLRIRAIAVNRTWELATWVDVIYAADAAWWTTPLNHLEGKTNHQNTVGFNGIKVCAEDTPFDDVLQIKNGGPDGFSDERDTIKTGGNSGYGAIHIAAHLGCKQILLCGFDMHGGHWHEPHKQLREHGEGIFERWIGRFETLAPELKQRGIEVLNCTPGSALKCFPMAGLSEALNGMVAIKAAA